VSAAGPQGLLRCVQPRAAPSQPLAVYEFFEFRVLFALSCNPLFTNTILLWGSWTRIELCALIRIKRKLRDISETASSP
jgi:hypothetical protein